MSELKRISAWGSRELIDLAFLILIIGLVSFQNYVHTGYQTQTSACVSNLHQIDGAATQFALEHHLTNDAPIHFPDDLTPYIRLNANGKIPSCPAGGIYHLSKVGDVPTCSLGNTVTPGHVLPQQLVKK